MQDCPCNTTWLGIVPRSAPQHAEPPAWPASDCDLPRHRSAELVIAHCAYSLNWVPGYVAEIEASGLLQVVRVVIYSKCGRRPSLVNISSPVLLRTLPNVGRNDHTYAHHLATEYDCLPSVSFFLKDRNVGGWLLKEQFTPAREMAELTMRSGFTCGFRSRRASSASFSVFANLSVLGQFKMAHHYLTKHSRKRRPMPADFAANCSHWDAGSGEHGRRWLGFRSRNCTEWGNFSALSHAFQSKTKPLAQWMNVSGIFPREHLEALTSQGLWYVCFGGAFAVQRSRIALWPVSTWRGLSDALSRADNLEEGHYAERTWGALLGPRLASDERLALIASARFGIGIYGLLKGCSCEKTRGRSHA
ncbi:hypothetical protein AB1Y20_020989 [Prymnesium parvum]|uniref:Hexosyltransferase n=1 Tax=Prymnesium parvum TaxID=97485 RepID=A0AB34JJ44_PRYPA